MNLFQRLDAALLEAEKSKPRVSREAFIWPSSASAVLYDQTEAKYAGKCHRNEVWKMIGEPETNPVDEVSARKFRMGRACEADVMQLAEDAGIFVASGVRAYIADINMTLEMDLMVLDPDSKQGHIVENKSIDGYFGNKSVIQEGNPKKDAVLQLMIYLNEFRTGSILKQVIKDNLEKVEQLKARKIRLESRLEELRGNELNNPEIKRLQADLAKVNYDLGRNRITVNKENLNKMSDGPLAGILAYEARDTCQTREFQVSIWEDPVLKKHFPLIDGEPYRWFDLESVYARWRQLKESFNRLRDEALRQMAEKGFQPPDEKLADPDKVASFWAEVGRIMRSLPKEFLPPAEFEWSYSAEKIERLWEAKLISKTKYNNWKKKAKGYERLGDWQCSFCSRTRKRGWHEDRSQL